MPGIDWIPGVSHLKAAVQVISGDTQGAGRTMENFHRECPGVSQITSIVQLARGDEDGAIETQKRCWGTINNVANGIPVVGHVKGVVHHAVGDHEGGNNALNAATRSTVVIASGAAAGLATGGIAAIPAGIAAGASYDIAATEITGKDQGYVAAIKNVVDNPSAGAIFDAAAIPVGDGLAGYSGGQVASKISTQVKLNSLEAARAAKADQLNVALDQGAAGGGGGGGGMTSGQAITIGKEINAITSEINVIKQGTPKYWVDAKSGEVVSAPPPSSVTVPVSGYVDENSEVEKEKSSTAPTRVHVPEYVTENNKKESEPLLEVSMPKYVDRNNEKRQEDLLNEISAELEDALDYDSYVDATVTKDNKKEKLSKLKKHDEQKPDRHIPQSNAQFTTLSELSELLHRINEDPNRDPNNDPTRTLEKRLSQLMRWSWIPLDMPEQFSYTAAVQLNSDVQGLHHSFIRHMTEWEDVISFDSALMNRLSPIMNEIRRLLSVTANTAQEAREKSQKAREDLRNALRKLANDVYLDVKKALVEIQMLLYRFMQENLTFDKYIGRTVNAEGHIQLHFKVKTITGKTKVMVVCVSDTLYHPWFNPPLYNDKRPTRTVVTVFFKPWWEGYSKTLLETKEEMENKKRI